MTFHRCHKGYSWEAKRIQRRGAKKKEENGDQKIEKSRVNMDRTEDQRIWEGVRNSNFIEPVIWTLIFWTLVYPLIFHRLSLIKKKDHYLNIDKEKNLSLVDPLPVILRDPMLLVGTFCLVFLRSSECLWAVSSLLSLYRRIEEILPGKSSGKFEVFIQVWRWKKKSQKRGHVLVHNSSLNEALRSSDLPDQRERLLRQPLLFPQRLPKQEQPRKELIQGGLRLFWPVSGLDLWASCRFWSRSRQEMKENGVRRDAPWISFSLITLTLLPSFTRFKEYWPSDYKEEECKGFRWLIHGWERHSPFFSSSLVWIVI